MINYQITPRINTHQIDVSISFAATTPCQLLKLPTWIPGSYMIREFSKNIGLISAKVGRRPINCVQIDKNTCSLIDLTEGQRVEISYSVYASDPGIRSAFLDEKRCYFNNTSICLAVCGAENKEHKLQIHHLPRGWKIATGLKSCSHNCYLANSYDELIDHPFELGNLTILEFVAFKIPHRLVLSGTIHANFDSRRLVNDVTNICEAQIGLFGGRALFTEYTFLLHLGGTIFTGLEHRNSTALLAPDYALPVAHKTAASDDYMKLLGLISHEYFHAWNVKQIKPMSFSPYDLYSENYTTLLWWFEGITSYYDDLMLYRSGIINEDKYCKILLDNINNVYKYTGATRESLVSSSLNSWVKYYRPDENTPNSGVSYYLKGALVGLCLDLLIRRESGGLKSLDDVLLGLFDKFLDDGLGIKEDELSQLIIKYSLCDIQEQINLFTQTVEMLPLNELLAHIGLNLIISPNAKMTDNGRVLKPKDMLEIQKAQIASSDTIDLGLKLEKEPLGYKVLVVYANGIGANCGIFSDDILIAFDDRKLTDIERILGLYKPSDVIKVTLFRRERLISVYVTLSTSPHQIYSLVIDDNDKLRLLAKSN